MRGRGGLVRAGIGALIILHSLGWVGAAAAADPVAVLTEIRAGQGEVRVKRAGEADWTAPQPLQALRPGDQLRVTADGRAVLAFTGGGAQTVTAANSPLTIQPLSAESGSQRVRGLLAGVTQFLLGQQKEPTYQALSVRGAGTPARLLSPRQTKVLPGPVTLEWTGPQAARYRVRLAGPQGSVWDQADLPRKPLLYPGTAPPLRPGVRYSWTVDTPGQPAQAAEFDVVSEAEASRIRAALAELAPSTTAGQYPAGTVTLMRAGLLFQEGLYADARRELLTAVAEDPDEPTLRMLLAYVYDRVGLAEQAAQEFDEAQFLSGGRP